MAAEKRRKAQPANHECSEHAERASQANRQTPDHLLQVFERDWSVTSRRVVIEILHKDVYLGQAAGIQMERQYSQDSPSRRRPDGKRPHRLALTPEHPTSRDERQRMPRDDEKAVQNRGNAKKHRQNVEHPIAQPCRGEPAKKERRAQHAPKEHPGVAASILREEDVVI